MKALLSLVILLVCFFFAPAQKVSPFLLGDSKILPDTFYFPFEQELQLIIIPSYDAWQNRVDYKEQTQPRGLTWASVMGPAPQNTYIFRNKAGEIVKSYPDIRLDTRFLRKIDFINSNETSLFAIRDYSECLRHFKIYGVDNKVGLINRKGEMVLPTIYDDIRRFQLYEGKQELLVVNKGPLFGLLDANLNVVVPPIYSTSTDSLSYGYPESNLRNDRYLMVFKNNQCGLIDLKGNILLDFVYDDIRVLHDGIFMCTNLKSKEELKTIPHISHWDTGYQLKSCALFDSTLGPICQLKDYTYIYYWGIKQLIVKKDLKFGVVNTDGAVEIPMEYDHISSYHGDFCVNKEKKFGIINTQGKVEMPVIFDGLEFYDPAIYVTQNGLIGVYSKEYKKIADPQFTLKDWKMGKYILTCPDGRTGFVHHEKNASYYQSPEGERIEF
ncbi:MAG: WG repeat-containing protein [Bacteroidia bacterium]|nr:WG repeat-containing protein [Bacteroidia bacterium]